MSYLRPAQWGLLLARSLRDAARPSPRVRAVPEAPADPPLISVIIPTYNWSNVLRLAIRSVLWQYEQRFEIQVVGDACTDGSEQAAKSFGDARIHWYNRAENSGSQPAPNNDGIARARGKYVAYLGHDDVWHPAHLRSMLAAIERERADVASSLTEMIGPAGTNYRVVTGFYPEGGYAAAEGLPPSGLMHRREAAGRIGGWKDYRTTWRNPDTDFVYRLWESGARFVSTGTLTVFKFNSALRKNSYIEKPCHEQAAYTKRIESSRFFLLQESLAIAKVHALRLPMKAPKLEPPPAPDTPGWAVSQYRKFRGLE
jgi:glycosyltransferase involved in cell wall biosynthesis